MSDILKSRHAFGSEANIQSAIDQGLIDAYDILFLKEGKIGWLDSEGNVVMHETHKIEFVQTLPEQGEAEVAYVYENKFYFWDGTEFKCNTSDSDITEAVVDEKITAAVNTANTYTDEKIAEAVAVVEF